MRDNGYSSDGRVGKSLPAHSFARPVRLVPLLAQRTVSTPAANTFPSLEAARGHARPQNHHRYHCRLSRRKREDFKQTLSFLEEVQFNGLFAFSFAAPRDGISGLPDDVPESERGAAAAGAGLNQAHQHAGLWAN